MTKFKDRIKFILKIVLYISIIFFIPIIITALYIIHNEGINSFQRGVSTFLLIILCTLLLLIICSQLKYGLIFSLNKLKFLENLVKNNILKISIDELKKIQNYWKIKNEVIDYKMDPVKRTQEKKYFGA